LRRERQPSEQYFRSNRSEMYPKTVTLPHQFNETMNPHESHTLPLDDGKGEAPAAALLQPISRQAARRLLIAVATILFAFVLPLCMQAEEPDGNTYPTSERLFYITRSLNKNLVCYDVNLKNGKLDTREPLRVYWVNREERPGETNGLNFFQRKMAYGYKVVSEGEDKSVVTLTAYSGKQLTICWMDTGYVCTATIQGQPAVLRSLYVKTGAKNPMSVEYVELRGTAMEGGNAVSERINK